MADGDILSRIDELVSEEHELRSRAIGAGLSSDDRARLAGVEQQLDQCWDLLRQRRARVEFDEDPDGAAVRPVSEVESYRQ
ncbi:DUF2630 family protein [Amycolatopsis sp. BJA-103]|uniref:DUF2630 family protein n=1 Tax=unclassified Amycolatopsis TaxID=2618356 RepID=UPI000C76CFBD|nr:DUF2630 family protein [Amycolatopsis sp. BJA-103]AUI57805.1 hypothetical protein BKN51_05900 [Amycolatopsis sp. BJA-103]PNE14191.1 hypothetical protein B1H26_36170 [Amycolatopsis sp. BJA-103]